MSVRIGLNLVTFPFSTTKAFWRWIDLCEENDIDSIWQTDRLVSKLPFLESMTTWPPSPAARRSSSSA